MFISRPVFAFFEVLIIVAKAKAFLPFFPILYYIIH
jgi:hypothetical protein